MLKWEQTLMGTLGMELVKQTDTSVEISMAVSERNVQPFGFLHGGASVALAETAASIGSAGIINHQEEICFGAEINANHIKSVREGIVTAVATLQHKGRSLHVWTIEIKNDKGELVCLSRCTMAVTKKRV